MPIVGICTPCVYAGLRGSRVKNRVKRSEKPNISVNRAAEFQLLAVTTSTDVAP